MKPLSRMPKVGDVIIRISHSDNEFTEGEEYRVYNLDSDGDAEVLDTNGNPTFIEYYELPRFTLKEEDEDPGYLDVYERYPIDTTGTGKVEVVVDAQSLALLYRLQKQHERTKARRKITEKIKALEDDLKKI